MVRAAPRVQMGGEPLGGLGVVWPVDGKGDLMGGAAVGHGRGHEGVTLGSQWVDARDQDLVAAGQLVRRDAFEEWPVA